MNPIAMDDGTRARAAMTLSSSEFFRSLKIDQIEQVLKAATVVRGASGDTLVKQGDPADSFFVLLAGELAVRLERSGPGRDPEDAVELCRLAAPAVVGEVGLLLGEARTATVVVVVDAELVRFERAAFEQMFPKIPGFGHAIAEGLARRLSQVSSRIPLVAWDATKAPDPAALALLPLTLMQRHRVLPLAIAGQVLSIGVVDDPTPAMLAAVRHHAPALELKAMRITADTFDRTLAGLAKAEGFATGATPPAAAAAPPSPRLQAILERVVAEGASDLHLSAGYRPHWRIDGDMLEMKDTDVLGPTAVLELLESVMDPRHRQEFAAASDTDFAYALPSGARFRINLFRDSRGVCAVLRLIPSKIMTSEQLGLPPVVKALCEIPKGLILVTGPTGSGKSTTLAAMVDAINHSRPAHIVTMEDPIEFVHVSDKCLINQREIGGHTTSFARALKAALREDPDIVLVGELRDLETVSLTLEMANTGHLVFATLHTNTAISSIDRIVDLYPAEQQAQVRSSLADVLRGVIAQTLMKRKDGGRIAALEILVANFAVANLIREAKTVQIPSIMQAGKKAGNQMLNDELEKLVERHKVTYPEALSKAVDKADFAKRFGKASPQGS